MAKRLREDDADEALDVRRARDGYYDTSASMMTAAMRKTTMAANITDRPDNAPKSSSAQLRACQHCGASGYVLDQGIGRAFRWRVSCVAKACGMTTPWCSEESLAVIIWNRRARRPARKAGARK